MWIVAPQKSQQQCPLGLSGELQCAGGQDTCTGATGDIGGRGQGQGQGAGGRGQGTREQRAAERDSVPHRQPAGSWGKGQPWLLGSC